MKVLIIGGDRRMIYAAGALKEKGCTVDTLGLLSNDKGNIKNADIILLPVPVTRDKVNINCALTKRTLPLELLKDLPEKALVFGGGNLDLNNYFNYLSLDEYALKNAAITAEGAISYAIENTDFSLWKSRILVIGYGKTGRALTKRLSGFCPELTVSARSARNFAELEIAGITSTGTRDIKKSEHGFDIVFNTVDIKFSKATAEALKSSLFIDISTFGGFEFDIAEKYKIKYKKLPSLPAACAPESAGKIIADTVINLVNVNGEEYA